jgi:hypothetical protein
MATTWWRGQAARWAGMLSVALLAACDGDSTGPSTELQGNRIYAVDSENRLVLFGATSAGTPASRTAISGLQAGEQVQGIDFRPADGKLYAVGSSSRVYMIDTVTAAATVVGTGFAPSLAGSAYGFDFNPVPDRIRTHSNAGQNLRLHPVTGALAFTDGVLAYAPGDPGVGSAYAITGTAYTNSVAGAATTTLYAIDSARDVLVTLASPNNGVMTTVGALGVNTGEDVGFDIFPGTGTAYATLTSSGRSSLYTINLATGQATLVGEIRGVGALRGIAVAP